MTIHSRLTLASRGRLLRLARAVLPAGAAVAACLGSPSAQAGNKQTAAVVVNTGARTASGALGTARSSAGNTQIIGCWGLVMQDTKYTGYCVATNSAGVTGSCFLPDGLFTGRWDVLQSLKEDSFLSFSWTASGECANLRVENYSYWEPLSP